LPGIILSCAISFVFFPHFSGVEIASRYAYQDVYLGSEGGGRMTKKFNLSVSDELAEKIKARREYLGNLSALFQEAIEAKIQKKEAFEKRLKGDVDMEATIERLRQERTEAQKDYRDYGKHEGLFFAKAASYTDLEYAALTFQPCSDGYYTKSKLMDDTILGEYFREYFQENPELNVNNEAVGEYRAQFLSDLAEEWIDGWVEGVREFWTEVVAKLNLI
jgi:post-segregation antitoxin (ccd killing protein)